MADRLCALHLTLSAPRYTLYFAADYSRAMRQSQQKAGILRRELDLCETLHYERALPMIGRC
jgi:hypothetical protein